MHLPRPRRLAVALASLALAGALAGCARPGAAAAGSSPTPNPQTAALRFAECMRQHGVNIPDPQTVQNGAGGGVVHEFKASPGAGGSGPDPNSAQFQSAQRACRSLLPNGGQMSAQQQAQARENALKFARCMRQHGIDIPDPQTGGNANGGGVFINGVGVGGGDVNPDDPAFQAAQRACQSLLGNPKGGNSGFSVQGPGGGGSGPVTDIGG